MQEQGGGAGKGAPAAPEQPAAEARKAQPAAALAGYTLPRGVEGAIEPDRLKALLECRVLDTPAGERYS